MKPMPNWPNGLMYHSESDIQVREFIIQSISHRLQQGMKELNPAIEFMRIETPSLVPEKIVAAHCESEFPVWKAVSTDDPETQLFLRPESTKGTYECFDLLFPIEKQLRKRLPLCLWQSGLSFRVEQDNTFKHLRFLQFYQMEFQLAYSEGTMADYHGHAVKVMSGILDDLMPRVTGIYDPDLLPFYSSKTTDLYLGEWEVVAISSRTDFRHPVIEISCGLDRLVAIFQGDVGFSASFKSS